jgi:MATE family multidrug resistance protein
MPDRRSTSTDRRGEILTGNLRKALFFLALPILAEQFLSFCVGFVDTWLSGRISAEATSAIGTAAYVGWLASLLFGLVGAGTTALVSRHWGSGDHVEANRIANRSMMLAAILGMLTCILFFSAAPLLARFLDMRGEQFRIAVHYLRIDAFGHFFGGISFVGAAALRGSGDTRSPMLIFGLVSLMNLVLSPLLVFGAGPIPAFGVDGIVFGTILARISGGTLMFVALSRGLSGLKLSRKEFTFRGDLVKRILRIGAPAVIDGVLIWTAQILFLKIINGINKTQPGAFAAHMIGIEMEAITYLPAVAWGLAAATMIGQSLGAEDDRRAVRAGHEAVLQCSLLGLIITLLFFFGAEVIYNMMHTVPAVHAAGIPAFRMNSLFQIPLMISIVYVFALRGAGDTRSPLLINVFGAVCVRVPLAYYCGVVLELGLLGAWIGMCSDVTVRAVLVWLRFIRCGWVKTKV